MPVRTNTKRILSCLLGPLLVFSLPLGAQPQTPPSRQALQNEETFTPALKPISSPPTTKTHPPTVEPIVSAPSKDPSSPKWLSTTPIAPPQEKQKKGQESKIIQPSLERMLNTATTLQVTETGVSPTNASDDPSASSASKSPASNDPAPTSSSSTSSSSTSSSSTSLTSKGTPDLPPVSSFPKEMPKDQESSVWYALGQSAIKIQEDLPDFRIILLNTQDPIVRSFSAMGLLKLTEQQFTKDTHGLAAFLLENAKVNKEAMTACYVVYDATFGGHIWRNFIGPFEDIQKGTDFLMAHEVAHCLDNHERLKQLASSKNFTSEEASAFGIEPHAWSRQGEGSLLSKTNYNKFGQNFFKDRAQTQYGERVADAFALLWLWKQGGPQNSIDILNQTRNRQSVWASHYTAPVFVGMEQFYEQHKQTPISLEKMWSIARAQQLKVGVDATVSTGEHKGIPPKASKEEQASKEETVAALPEKEAPQKESPSSESPPAPPKLGSPPEKPQPPKKEEQAPRPVVTTLPSLGPQVTFSDVPIDPVTLKKPVEMTSPPPPSQKSKDE